MKIIFVTHDFDAGGAARSLRMLVPRLHEFGHHLTIVSLTKPRPEMEPWQVYSALGIKTHHLPFPWIALEYVGATVPDANYPPHMRQLHKESVHKLKELTPDVVCFNGYPSTSLAPYIRGRRKILFAREVIKTGTPLFQQSIRLLRRNIHKAIAIGPVELKQLLEIGLKAEVVFNSAKTVPTFITPEPPPPIHFGCFGKIYNDKGQHQLMIACSAIKGHLRNARAHIHLYGNGEKSYMNTLTSIVQRHGLHDLITFYGWTSDVEKQMEKMHCVVRPDRTGSPWGRDIIEAMSIGRPVLATGSEDIFIKNGHTGWLVPPNSPEHLARKMLDICNDPCALSRAGEAAFNFACDHFDPEVNARRVEKILSAAN